MTSKNENPVYYVDFDRLTTAKAEMQLYCQTANLILADLSQLQVSTPENKDEAIDLIYSGTDKILKIITAQQIEKMAALPLAAAQKLVVIPQKELNILNQKIFALQNRNSTAKINHVDFVTFSDEGFQPDMEKLEKHFTIIRTQTIIEAERLAGELIDSLNRLKDYCTENGYPGKVVEYDSFLNWSESEQSFSINPVGMQYFK